jgi:hypothetical protein
LQGKAGFAAHAPADRDPSLRPIPAFIPKTNVKRERKGREEKMIPFIREEKEIF